MLYYIILLICFFKNTFKAFNAVKGRLSENLFKRCKFLLVPI